MKLAQRPILTQAVTSAILFATGDTVAQQVVERKGIQNQEWARTGRMALYGGAVFGPAATTWFKFLQNKVVLKNKNLEIIARVGADQSFFASTNLFCFLSSMAIMEGSDPKEKLEKSYWNALTTNWMVWPFVQGGNEFTPFLTMLANNPTLVVNFKFVPLHHRVLLVNILSIGWNCYLSALASQG
ncbi:putative protein sym-1 [Coleophoma cylindrospora]|uniref:Uncharacterized protein n=1 Tax=Coleophoma cylindrospora TaxID=1849047 RepID=A0A3D8RHA3_9HELO|nr:putative protein sym-1 [Coleophoma cylindrospora]